MCHSYGATLGRLLTNQEPFPAFVVDSRWNLVAANYATDLLIGPVAQSLRVPPINVLRVVLHPEGMAPRLNNLTEVHQRLMRLLRRQIALTGTDYLTDLERELAGYRDVPEVPSVADKDNPIVVPFQLWAGRVLLNLIGVTAFFGTPWDTAPVGPSAGFLFPADQPTRMFLFDNSGASAEAFGDRACESPQE